MQITTTNPATEETLATYEAMNSAAVNQLVGQARSAFPEWSRDYERRRSCMYSLVSYLKKNKQELARVATQEMGKAIRESVSEVEKCAWALEFYADHASIFLSDEMLSTDARKSFVAFEPLGVIGSIMPWNFPYWQGLRFAAPCLMAGNAVILKSSSLTVQCGIELEKAFLESGFPKGVFQNLTGSVDSANALLDSAIDAVTFTGSAPAGSHVAQRAAARLKKCVLELGGSDPFIVLDDADLKKAAAGAVKGRFINCGQSCIASKRFFVAEEAAEEFTELFVREASRLRTDDPMSAGTDMGPLSSRSGLDSVSGMVADARAKGADVVLGGEAAGDRGFFYEPTILRQVTPDMRAAREETFGPIAPVTPVRDADEAVSLANDTEFGLGASIWTRDLARAEELSRRIASGIVSVNNVVLSDPRIPFGGIKHSGFGRELSRYGMLEFVNIKSVRFYDNLTHQHHVE